MPGFRLSETGEAMGVGIKANEREINKLISEMRLTDNVHIKRRSGSIGIEVVGPAGRRMVFAAITPSDWRDKRNLRRDLKRAAHEVGLRND